MVAIPTTTEYWDVDGTILNRYGWNISTIGSGRGSLPPLKGSDVVVPYATGDFWRAKMAGGRTITLSMWVLGQGVDGDPVGDNEQAYNDNLFALQKALYIPQRQFTLRKRWKSASGLITASAKGQYAGGLDPSMSGRTMSKFSVDVRLANPWFYAPVSTTPNIARSGNQNMTNAGLVLLDGYGMVVTMVGPLGTGAKVQATQSGQTSVWVQLNTALGSGESVSFDIANFLAFKNDGTNMIQYVTHGGHRSWMIGYPGVTNYALTAPSGSGYATVAFQEAYA